MAARILGSHAAELERTPGRSAGYKPRPFSIALRAFLVARSRYAEDLLARAVEGGVSQYVLLGAGLDTFAHRNPWEELRVFEVDHPATQMWKRELLAASELEPPANLRYAPVDFERQGLAEGLRASGFDAAAPAFFAWLGVVPYLTRIAFRERLGFVRAGAAGSGVVFDYGQPRSVLPWREQLARASLAARVHMAGEPFRLFFTPEELRSELAAFGEIEDLGTEEINARYFEGRSDGLKLMGSGGRMVSAWV